MTKNNSSATKRLTIESASIGSHGTERSTPPANAPDGGVWGTIKYNGEKSRKRNAVGCAFLIIPFLFMMGCPKDEKDAYSVWEENDIYLYNSIGKKMGLRKNYKWQGATAISSQ